MLNRNKTRRRPSREAGPGITPSANSHHSRAGKAPRKAEQSTAQSPHIILAFTLMLMIVIAMALALAACANQSGPSAGGTGAAGGNSVSGGGASGNNSGNSGGGSQQPGQSGSSSAAATVIAEGESLVIKVADISDQASFYPVEVDGVRMEVIAVKAPDGSIRTAFNTCQICYDSGRGYYKQSGNKLVCQNCGNQFSTSQVEVESGGCNPWPIFAEDKTVTKDSISISYGFFKKSKEIFANWKS